MRPRPSADAPLRRPSRRPLAIALGLLTSVTVALVGAGPSRAQGPGPSPAPATSDGGVTVDSTYGCVESVPKGAQRPLVFDTFPTRGTSGWAATLSITVRHGKGERVLPSGLDLSSAAEAKKVLKQAGFAVPDQDGGAGARLWTEPDDPQKTEATTHLELPLVLLPPNPGRNGMVLPPLPVAVARANGEIATVCTHGHPILVEDPIANTPDAMPKPNPPGLPQREEWTSLKRALAWTSLGVLCGAIVALLVWRRVTRPKAAPPPPPPRPPWEIALEELDEVRHAGLLEVNRYSEYFDRTSDALRRYLGARFGFDGLESTTDEILAALKRQASGFVRFDAGAQPEGPTLAVPSPGVAFDRISRFLRECDLVKFANLTPTPEQCAASITTCEAIVRGTMPTAVARVLEERSPAIEPSVTRAAGSPPSEVAPSKPARSPYEPPDPGEDAPSRAPLRTGRDVPHQGTAEPGSVTSTPPRDPPAGGST